MSTSSFLLRVKSALLPRFVALRSRKALFGLLLSAPLLMLPAQATTNFQSFSTDASNLGTTLFFSALLGILVSLGFALATGALAQRKLLALVEVLVVGVVSTVVIAGFTTFVTGQGAIASGMITGTWGSIASLTPGVSSGMTEATLAQLLEQSELGAL
ncbi:hypothetical protein [Candidatus Cyanaurora vandensis]|uniref:hypothetical protein n=1 Tax=Candidatus Cyanaurora vandensis TaxID=2714958 RepID=UPI00258071BE|nr:hypothetical protein [Candidatus Cyanaurora vandensis]